MGSKLDPSIICIELPDFLVNENNRANFVDSFKLLEKNEKSEEIYKAHHVDIETNHDPVNEYDEYKFKSPLKWINDSKSLTIIDYEINDESTILEHIQLRKPFVIRNAPIGECTRLWKDIEYLKSCKPAIGNGKVSVHVLDSTRMNFQPRNYKFEVLDWDVFLKDVCSEGEDKKIMYLRSIGSNPRKFPSNLSESFPCLAKDISLPGFMTPLLKAEVSRHGSSETTSSLADVSSETHSSFFSSVLRISSKELQLFTHYDIMDNILIQITNEKFVTIFPPEECTNLLSPNDDLDQSNSSFIDIFYPYQSPFPDDLNPPIKEKPIGYEKFLKSTKNCQTGILSSGDILYIPALWFHNLYSLPIKDGSNLPSPTISVNLFWKHLSSNEYERKDLVILNISKI